LKGVDRSALVSALAWNEFRRIGAEIRWCPREIGKSGKMDLPTSNSRQFSMHKEAAVELQSTLKHFI
jgi:hypothetical protein